MNERVNPFKKLQKPGKHVKRIVIGAAGLVIIAGLAGDATYQIQEQEQAVLTTFGVPKAVAETGRDPGGGRGAGIYENSCAGLWRRGQK